MSASRRRMRRRGPAASRLDRSTLRPGAVTDRSEREMLQDRVCMLCEGSGVARHGPTPGRKCLPCNGTGQMTEANHELAVKSWREHRRRRQVGESAERRDSDGGAASGQLTGTTSLSKRQRSRYIFGVTPRRLPQFF